MRKILFLTMLFALAANVYASKMDKLVYAGPFTAVSYPLIVMAEWNSMSDFAEKSEFRYWQNPDQLRAMIMGEQADVVAAPSYVGATFYNKGIPLKMMNISVWGILHMVSTDKNVKTFADLRGKKVVVPFRGEMPDIVFRNLVKANGIDADKEYDLHYVAHPMDVAQLLLSGRADYALTAEPAATMSIKKSMMLSKKGKAKPQYKVINLQKEWGRVYNAPARIAQACSLALPSVTKNPDFLKKFDIEFEKALNWIVANPKKAAGIVSKYIPQLKKGMILAGIQQSGLKAVKAADAKDEVMHFFTVLQKFDPKKVGGKLPDEGLFYNAKN